MTFLSEALQALEDNWIPQSDFEYRETFIVVSGWEGGYVDR